MKLFPQPKNVIVAAPKPELAKRKRCCGHLDGHAKLDHCGHAPLGHCGHGA